MALVIFFSSTRICSRSRASRLLSGSSISKNLRLGDHRTRHRHALLLPAAQVRRRAILEAIELHALQRSAHFLRDLVFGNSSFAL